MVKFTIEISIDENKNTLEAIRKACDVIREDMKNIKGIRRYKPLVETGVEED